MARPLRPRQINPMPFAARLSATIEETCQATGLGKTTIYEMINAGAIETSTIGARRLVLVRSLLPIIDPTRNPTHKTDPEAGGEVRNTTEDEPSRERQRIAALAAKYGPRRLRSSA